MRAPHGLARGNCLCLPACGVVVVKHAPLMWLLFAGGQEVCGGRHAARHAAAGAHWQHWNVRCAWLLPARLINGVNAEPGGAATCWQGFYLNGYARWF
jgi:hypothetical protein